MSRLSRDITHVVGKNGKFAAEGTEDDPTWGWKDLPAPLFASQSVGANTPGWTAFRDGIETLSFSASTMNEAWITFHPNHDIIEGEDFFFHIHWAPNTTSTGVVRWGIEYTIAKGFSQAAFPASTTFYMEETISADSQYTHVITEASAAQGIAMPEVDSLILVRVFRDAAHVNDTFPDAVSAFVVDIHYKAGQLFTVGKRPDFNEEDS